MPRLVAGVDSSTQSCKVVIRDADTGQLVRSGRATHPEGTEVAPERWWEALRAALADAGGLDDVVALSVGGQQHGMVALDAEGRVVRDALLWNDTRSAGAAAQLVAELGPGVWATRTGSVPVASYTVTKLRWLAEHEPANAARVAAVALPHDWLAWRLAGYGPAGEAPLGPDLTALATDRSDASGTGYFSPRTGDYDRDLLVRALGHDAVLPRVAAAAERVGSVHDTDVALGPGAGDNAAAALGLGLGVGDTAVSIGTSGVVCAVSDTPAQDETGLVSGFADATGRYLPLIATLNAARVLDAAAAWLSVDHPRLSELALSAPSGADGLVLVPYLEGERTPNLPTATGSLHGIRLATSTPAHFARAAVEGMLCGLADGLDALRAAGLRPRTVRLIGGAARSPAVRQVAAEVLGLDVLVPEPGEYVADGAARQAAWVASGADTAPDWQIGSDVHVPAEPAAGAAVRERYAQARSRYLEAPAGRPLTSG
ncbi:MAG TPA: xylulokinase [Intrasporangium sp.]|uniref:xylulokinase n=1 Tax=Intrasporangium sp. TaxID=1925024 RepID=UPI002D769287|nr:xylulokinase [Intrasporangium sp.]HET7398271.1 xylulokinase [Intrasporangium sp.]